MEKSSFFNAVLDANGTPDRVYLAEDFAQFFSTFIGNGVFPNPSSQLQVVAVDGDMTIRIKAGYAWINGYMYQNTDDYILDIDNADGVLNRIDRVVLRLDFLERKIRRAVKKGDYASNAVPKTLQRDADAYEIALADVYVNKGIISITQANITDLRLNKDLCGIVHGTVDQADTTAIFNQFQSWYSQKQDEYNTDIEQWTQKKKQDFDTWYTTNTAAFMEQFNSWYNTNTTQWSNEFTTWFSTIKEQLDGDVAAKLSADVVALKEGKVDKVTGKGLSANDYSDAEKQVVAKIPDIESHLTDKVNYTDLTPVITTGTSSDYVATIPTNIVEVTIVPHINNLVGATLNSVPILDREGKPIGKDVLKMNIPTKIVRVGSNFFIASCGGKVDSIRFRIFPPVQLADERISSFPYILAMNDEYVVYQNMKQNYAYIVFVVNRKTGELLYSRSDMGALLSDLGSIRTPGIIVGDIFIGKFSLNTSQLSPKYIRWNLKTNEISEIPFVDKDAAYRFIKSKDGYIYGIDGSPRYRLVKLTSSGELIMEKPLNDNTKQVGYFYDDYDYLYCHIISTRMYRKYSKETLELIEVVSLTGTNWTFQRNKVFVTDEGVAFIIYGSDLSIFPVWNSGGNASIYITAIRGIAGISDEYIYVVDSLNCIRRINRKDYSFGSFVYSRDISITDQDLVYMDKNTFALTSYTEYISSYGGESIAITRTGAYFEY